MSNDGGPVFPRAGAIGISPEDGLSLRDYFAAAALTGFIATGKQPVDPDHNRVLTYPQAAFMIADMMLAERSVTDLEKPE